MTSTEASAIRTFLIADVRGYTAFTQHEGDEAAGRLAAAFAEIAQEGVEAWGGVLLELRGDEALAVFSSARSALRAATELVEAFAEASRDDPALPLGVGFGLDAGEAVPVAGGYRGGALNLAARLCSKAGAGEVLASEGVIHLANAIEGLSYQPTEPFEMKGINEPVRAVRITPSRPPEPTSPRTTEDKTGADLPQELDLVSPFVGRETELRWLRWSWRRARHGHCRGVFIIGEPGMGRTRLAAELARAASLDGATVSYISCAEPSDGTLKRLKQAASTDGPTVIVVDDLSVEIEGAREVLAAVLDPAEERDLLVVATCDQPVTPWANDLMHHVDPDGMARRWLQPLTPHEVVELAAAYTGVVPTDLPLTDLMEDTGGSPELLHAYVIDWTVGHATNRLNLSASSTGTQRSSLRAAEADLAVTVAEMELARERARIHRIEAGRSTGAPRAATVCPFKGLATFDPADADFFFGREQLIAEMVARSVGASFLGVVGPSGSGKSSAVRAGLMPALAGGALPGSEGWEQRLMRPGPHPMAEVERFATANDRQLLVIDQFEETFTACTDEDERAAFVDAIASPPEGRIVVAAVRADFYGRCAEYPALARLFGATHVLVGPMDERELRRAIELPARRAGLRVEPPLVDALVGEVAEEPGGLPLMSTTLLELWQHRDGRTLTLESYLETGGVRAAVARLAEDAYARLSAEQQIVARSMLLRMAGAGFGDAAVRRRVPLEELDVERDEDAAQVLTVLADARLVTVSEGSAEVAHEALLREWPRLRRWLEEDVQGRQLHLHLIEATREWSAGGQDPADLYRGARLASAMDWTAQHTVELNEQERDFLEQSREASQAEVQQTRRMNRRLKGSLAGVAVMLVIALVGATLALQQRGRARTGFRVSESKRLAAQAVAEPDLGRSVELALAGLSLDDSVDTRGALLQVLQSNPSAIGLTPTSDKIADVATTPDGQTLVTEQEDGSLAFFDTTTRTLEGSPLPVLDAGDDGKMAVDPTGLRIAIAGEFGHDNRVGLVDATTRRVIRSVSFGDSPILSLAFSPDGKHLTVASSDYQTTTLNNIVNRWLAIIDPKNGSERYLGVGKLNLALEANHDARGATGVAYLPDGDLAVSWFNGGTTIWNVDTQRPVRRPFPVGGPTIAVSDDGGTLAVGEVNGAVSLIDLRTGKIRTTSAHRDGMVTDAVFTPDGSTLITSGTDGEIDVWDIASARLLTRLQGTGGLAVSPDGGTLYASDSDTQFSTWDLSGARGLAESRDINVGAPWFGVDAGRGLVAYTRAGGLNGGTADIGIWDTTSGSVSTVHVLAGQQCTPAVSPDGTRLLMSCDGGNERSRRNIVLVELGTGDQKILQSEGATWEGTFSPDGHLFATMSDDYFPVEENARARASTVILWDAATLQPVHSLGLNGTAAPRSGLAFSPDGHYIAAAASLASYDTAVWDVTTGRVVASPEAVDQVEVKSLAFSPDGQRLALALASGAIRILNTSTWTDAVPPISTPADSIAFSPDSSTLAVSSEGAVSLWDVASGRRLGDAYQGPPSASFGTVHFLPDGRLVLLVKDQGAFIYRADPASWKAQACSIVGDITPAEWQQLVPDQPYRSVCSS
jgi:WD40 repeat protein/class 3 adenylate cyclase